jgi:hypothetical protein
VGIPPAKCVYTISTLASLSLNSFFDDFFSGQLLVSGSSIVGSSMLQTVWNLGNINFTTVEATFSNVADSMTSSIRQNGEYSLAGYKTGDVNRDENVRPSAMGLDGVPGCVVGNDDRFFRGDGGGDESKRCRWLGTDDAGSAGGRRLIALRR